MLISESALATVVNDLPTERDAFALNALFVLADSIPIEEEKTPRFQRLLWVAPDGEHLVMIEVTSNNLPFFTTRDALLHDLDAGVLILQPRDPFAPPPVREEELTERERDIRDRRWQLIEPLVTDAKRCIFYPDHRGALIAEASEVGGTSRAKIHKYVRVYWCGGQVLNALLPAYHRCGGRGKTKAIKGKKRGRPSRLASMDVELSGINITNKQADDLVEGGREFIEGKKLSQKKAYKETLRKYFNKGNEYKDGLLVPVMPEAHLLPTFDQFLYYYKIARSNPDAISVRVGSRRYLLRHRPALGSSTDDAPAPGARYQVDATVGDIYLLSSIVRGRVIGRPVIYIVVDAFSRMIVGFYVGLEGPSWLGMMLALENAFTSKVEFCRRYGRDITADDWPCHHLPEGLLGDRGELISKHASHLVRAFNVPVLNTGSWRADWKAIVERNFRTLNDEVIDWQPGAVHEVRERGEPDYRLDATLTLKDFAEMMIVLILHYNHNRAIQEDALPLGYPYPENGDPAPIDLWNWGIEHRSGYLRAAGQERVRANLLPAQEVPATTRGLSYHGLHYAPLNLLDAYADRDPSEAQFETWFLRNLGRRTRSVELAVDPRDVSFAYMRLDRGRVLVPCGLLRGDRRFAGMTLQEVLDARAVRKVGNQLNRTKAQQEWNEFRAKIEAIEAGACERRVDALGSANAPADASNIRETRSIERRELQREEAWRPEGVSGSDAAPDDAARATEDPEDQESGYVPPPSNLDLLAAAKARRRGEEPS